MAVFLMNICKFDGCGIKFETLNELIKHIEVIHIDYDPKVVALKERSQPACIPLSYVLRFITEDVRTENTCLSSTAGNNNVGSDQKRKLAIKHHSYSMSSSNRSNTPTGSEMDEDEMAVSESEDSNDSWTTEEFSSEFIMRYGSRHSVSGNNGTPGNEKPFACPVPGCKKRYKNVNGIKYHSKNGHKKDGKVRKGYKCHCGKSYKTAQGLKNHALLAHNTPESVLTTQQVANAGLIIRSTSPSQSLGSLSPSSISNMSSSASSCHGGSGGGGGGGSTSNATIQNNGTNLLQQTQLQHNGLVINTNNSNLTTAALNSALFQQQINNANDNSTLQNTINTNSICNMNNNCATTTNNSNNSVNNNLTLRNTIGLVSIKANTNTNTMNIATVNATAAKAVATNLLAANATASKILKLATGVASGSITNNVDIMQQHKIQLQTAMDVGNGIVVANNIGNRKQQEQLIAHTPLSPTTATGTATATATKINLPNLVNLGILTPATSPTKVTTPQAITFNQQLNNSMANLTTGTTTSSSTLSTSSVSQQKLQAFRNKQTTSTNKSLIQCKLIEETEKNKIDFQKFTPIDKKFITYQNNTKILQFNPRNFTTSTPSIPFSIIKNNFSNNNQLKRLETYKQISKSMQRKMKLKAKYQIIKKLRNKHILKFHKIQENFLKNIISKNYIKHHKSVNNALVTSTIYPSIFMNIGSMKLPHVYSFRIKFFNTFGIYTELCLKTIRYKFNFKNNNQDKIVPKMIEKDVGMKSVNENQATQFKQLDLNSIVLSNANASENIFKIPRIQNNRTPNTVILNNSVNIPLVVRFSQVKQAMNKENMTTLKKISEKDNKYTYSKTNLNNENGNSILQSNIAYGRAELNNSNLKPFIENTFNVSDQSNRILKYQNYNRNLPENATNAYNKYNILINQQNQYLNMSNLNKADASQSIKFKTIENSHTNKKTLNISEFFNMDMDNINDISIANDIRKPIKRVHQTGSNIIEDQSHKSPIKIKKFINTQLNNTENQLSIEKIVENSIYTPDRPILHTVNNGITKNNMISNQFLTPFSTSTVTTIDASNVKTKLNFTSDKVIQLSNHHQNINDVMWSSFNTVRDKNNSKSYNATTTNEINTTIEVFDSVNYENQFNVDIPYFKLHDIDDENPFLAPLGFNATELMNMTYIDEMPSVDTSMANRFMSNNVHTITKLTENEVRKINTKNIIPITLTTSNEKKNVKKINVADIAGTSSSHKVENKDKKTNTYNAKIINTSYITEASTSHISAHDIKIENRVNRIIPNTLTKPIERKNAELIDTANVDDSTRNVEKKVIPIMCDNKKSNPVVVSTATLNTKNVMPIGKVKSAASNLISTPVDIIGTMCANKTNIKTVVVKPIAQTVDINNIKLRTNEVTNNLISTPIKIGDSNFANKTIKQNLPTSLTNNDNNIIIKPIHTTVGKNKTKITYNKDIKRVAGNNDSDEIIGFKVTDKINTKRNVITPSLGINNQTKPMTTMNVNDDSINSNAKNNLPNFYNDKDSKSKL